MNRFTEKFSEVFKATMPIIIFALISSIYFLNFDLQNVIEFLASSLGLIFGISLFMIGVDIAIMPFGRLLGPYIIKSNKLLKVIIATFILGFAISVAEPSLLVLAKEISIMTLGTINLISLLAVVSIGLGIGLVLGIIRIIFNLRLHVMLFILYSIIFILSIFSTPFLISVAFDSSGATTGILAVPFVLAFAHGITAKEKDSKSSEKDTFGLIALASGGAILTVLIYSLFIKNNISLVKDVREVSTSTALDLLRDVVLVFIPTIIIFILTNIKKLKIKKLKPFVLGFIYSFLGLYLFLISIESGFMEIGYNLGVELAHHNNIIILSYTFIMGLVVIIAEPAIQILTNQIVEVTSGYIGKKTVLTFIALGVSLSLFLSVLKIIYPVISLTSILFVGYLITLLLMLFSPKIFIGIAFDAGGVATGPLVATFVLSYVLGVGSVLPSDLLVGSLGMISLIALGPIISVQILGVLFKLKTIKEGIYER